MSLKSLLVAGFVGLAGVAAAAAPTEAQNTPPITAENVTDEHIAGFVKAAIALEELRKDYTQRIIEAGSDDEKAALKAEADNVAMQLVEKVRGITTDEYLAISKISQESPELTARISAEVERMRAQKDEFEKQQAEAAKAREAQKAQEAMEAMESQAGTSTAEE